MLSFLIFTVGAVNAAHWIVGYVNNATDYTPASGHKVLIYKTNTSNNITVDIDSSNVFFADCELLPTSCELGDKIFVKVIDTGDGYTTQATEVVVSESGYDTAQNSTLLPPSCPKTGHLLTLDAKTQYRPGETVSVSGILINSSCKPVTNKLVAVEVKNFNNNTPIYVNQTKTAATGVFGVSFVLASDTPKAVYRITAASFETNSARFFDFEVCTDCDNDGFSGNDCNDNNNSISPSKTDVCGNSIDEDCSGSDATCPANTTTTTTTTTTGTTTTGSGSSSSTPPKNTTSASTGNAPACSEAWVCGQWGDCIDGEKTRDCVDQNSCGTTANKPRTTESCTMENTTGAGAQPGAGITGLAIGGVSVWPWWIIVAIIIILLYIFLKKRKKNKAKGKPEVSFTPSAEKVKRPRKRTTKSKK